MWKAVTLDVKITSLSPAQNFHLRAVRQKICLFLMFEHR